MAVRSFWHNLGHRYLKQVAGEIFVATGQQKQISEKAVTIAFVEFFERRLVPVRHAHRHASDALGVFVRQKNNLFAHDGFRSRPTAQTLPDHIREGKVKLGGWRPATASFPFMAGWRTCLSYHQHFSRHSFSPAKAEPARSPASVVRELPPPYRAALDCPAR